MLMAALAAMLLATAGSLMLIEARAARAAAGEGLRLARAQFETESLLALALVRLDSGDAIASQGVMFEDEHGRVLRQDAAGLLDVNAAPPERLAALFAALGAGEAQAAMLGARIADWRDEDELVRTHGAERAQYAEAVLGPPGNRPFETEGEIALVLGMPDALLACALPFLTVYAAAAEPDAAAAPPDLRALLALASETPIATNAPFGQVIALSAEAPLSEHAVLRRTIWIRLTGDPARPVLTHRGAQDFAPRTPQPRSCVEARR